MGANWGSRLEHIDPGSTTNDTYAINQAKRDDNILNWFQTTGEGLLAPVTNIIQDCEASPPPSAAKIIGDVSQAVVFVAVIVSSAADFGESFAILETIIEAGEGADIAIGAALGVGEKVIEDEGVKAVEEATSVFNQIKTSLSSAKVQDYANAISVVGSVANLGANWAQMDLIDSSNPLKSFSNAIFQGINTFVGVYGSLEEQLAVNIAVVATGKDAKNPAAYLAAITTATGASDHTSIFRRDLSDAESRALKAASSFINVSFIAASGSTSPNDYIGAIINGFGGTAGNFALVNVVAQFAQASGNPDTGSIMMQG